MKPAERYMIASWEKELRATRQRSKSWLRLAPNLAHAQEREQVRRMALAQEKQAKLIEKMLARYRKVWS